MIVFGMLGKGICGEDKGLETIGAVTGAITGAVTGMLDTGFCTGEDIGLVAIGEDMGKLGLVIGRITDGMLGT